MLRSGNAGRPGVVGRPSGRRVLLAFTLLLAGLGVAAGPATAVERCFGRVATLTVADAVDGVIIGTAGPDVIVGGGGPDVIFAMGGRDRVCGRGGNDTIMPENGRDLVDGGPGRDELLLHTGIAVTYRKRGEGSMADGTVFESIERIGGSSRRDTVTVKGATAGRLRIATGPGDDRVVIDASGTVRVDYAGGRGRDTLSYAPSAAAVGVVPDKATGTQVAVQDGGSVSSNVVAAGVERYEGSRNGDRFLVFTGKQYFGRAGNDRFGFVGKPFMSGFRAARIDGGPGTDWISFGGPAWPKGVEVDLPRGAVNRRGGGPQSPVGDVEKITGTAHRDVMRGTAGGEVLEGGAGPDDLDGGRGDDVLRGEAGGDVLRGGPGDDLADGGAGTDTATFERNARGVTARLDAGTATGAGKDTLRHVENLIGTNDADVLRGNNGPNVLSGRDGRDRLLGRGGNDTLFGNAGNDFADGGGGRDTCFAERKVRCGRGGGGGGGGTVVWKLDRVSPAKVVIDTVNGLDGQLNKNGSFNMTYQPGGGTDMTFTGSFDVPPSTLKPGRNVDLATTGTSSGTGSQKLTVTLCHLVEGLALDVSTCSQFGRNVSGVPSADAGNLRFKPPTPGSAGDELEVSMNVRFLAKIDFVYVAE